jgi:hypothetical protein
MARSKRTKIWGKLSKQQFFGIDPSTCEVVRIWESTDGQLSRVNEDLSSFIHAIAPGRDARTEIVVTFGLTNVFGIPAAYDSRESPEVQALELKAASMRAKREAQSR